MTTTPVPTQHGQTGVDLTSTQLAEQMRTVQAEAFGLANKTCQWVFTPIDLDARCYDTECGETHLFCEGGLAENHYRFCPYCGLPIQVAEEATA